MKEMFDKVDGSSASLTVLFGGSHSGVNGDGSVRQPEPKKKKKKLPRTVRGFRKERVEEAVHYGMEPKDLAGL